MSETVIRVDLGPRSYDIAIAADALEGVGGFARPRCSGTLALVVADANVRLHADRVRASLQSSGFQAHLHLMAPGEAQKTLACLH